MRKYCDIIAAMNKVEIYPTPLRREAAILMLSPLLRSDVIKDPECDGLADFERMLLEGFGGVVVFKHFSLKDPPLILKEIGSLSEVVRRRKIIVPTSSHQVLPGEMTLANTLGIRIDKIVTRNTIEDARRKGKPEPILNEGAAEFTLGALDTVNRGGILFIAPEAERRNNLKPYEARTIGTLMASAKRRGVNNIAFLFIDLRLAGREENYWGKKGVNLLNRYVTRIGRALTLDQVMKMAGGKFSNVDSDVILPEMRRTAAIQRPPL